MHRDKKNYSDDVFYALRYFFIDKPDAPCYISSESNMKQMLLQT